MGEAAAAGNAKCIELGIPIKNPGVPSNIPTPKRKQKIRNANIPKSKYRYVYWDSKTRKWRAQMVHKGKTYSLGTYEQEEDAAHAINRKCCELGLSPRNKNLDPNTIPTISQKKRKGKYACVYWSEEKGKWLGQFMHQKKRTFIGYFNTELEAAQAVNKKCANLGIKLKNPEIAQQFQPQDDQEMHISSTGAQNYTLSDEEIGDEKEEEEEGEEEGKEEGEEQVEEEQASEVTESEDETLTTSSSVSEENADDLEMQSRENRIRIAQRDQGILAQRRRVEEQKRVLDGQEDQLRQLRQTLEKQKKLYLKILQEKQQKEKE